MNLEQKNALLIERIEQLEKENADLKKANNILTGRLEENKTQISTREDELKNQEKQLKDLFEAYNKAMLEFKNARRAYETSTKNAREAKSKYESEVKSLLKQLRKQV